MCVVYLIVGPNIPSRCVVAKRAERIGVLVNKMQVLRNALPDVTSVDTNLQALGQLGECGSSGNFNPVQPRYSEIIKASTTKLSGCIERPIMYLLTYKSRDDDLI